MDPGKIVTAFVDAIQRKDFQEFAALVDDSDKMYLKYFKGVSDAEYDHPDRLTVLMRIIDETCDLTVDFCDCIITKLVDAGTNLDIVNSFGESALSFAICKESSSFATALLKAGANLFVTNPHPIFLALATENIEIFTLMFQPEMVSVIAEFNTTLLHHACSNGNREIFDILIAAGADINAIDTMGVAPIICAITSNEPELVQALVDLGADLSITGVCKATPLHAVCYYGNVNMFEILIAQKETHVQLENRDNSNCTMLHTACYHGQYDLIPLLIKAGADFNALAEDEMTVLHILVQKNGTEEVIELFLESLICGTDVF